MATAATHPPRVTNNNHNYYYNTSSPAYSHSTNFNGKPELPTSSASQGVHSSTMAPATVAKKTKGKKPADPNETSKLLAAKISQLEQDAAGEKDQEAEIGR